MWILYQIAIAVALVTAAPWLLARRGRHYLETLPGRLGRGLGPEQSHDLWLHAVSVGEVAVAATLCRSVPGNCSLLVTTTTPTGQARARALLGDRATVSYLPFDLGFTLRRFFSHNQPSSLVLVEGELWPLLLRTAKRRGLEITVVNGRISDRNYRRLRRLRRLVGPLIAPIDRFGVQSEQDRERLLDLGADADRIVVTGNLKYDSPEPARAPELEALLAAAAGGRPLLIAGSTMPGEEELVLDAFERLGGGGRALLVLAPRHPERFDAVAATIRRAELPLARRSQWRSQRPDPGGAPQSGSPAVLLLDTLGELAAAYRGAAGCFIGGSLVPTGGHNPLEAARFGVAIAVGPSTHNFRDIAQSFDRHSAWRRVDSPAALAEAWRQWLSDPADTARLGARALELFDRDRGALARTLALLEPLFAPRIR